MYKRLIPALLFTVLASSPAFAQAARDMIDMSQVAVYNSPRDVASWPITHAISGLHMRPTGAFNAGLSFDSSALDAWPDFVPPGFDGPLGPVWAVVKINGTWSTSGFIQTWRGRIYRRASLTDFARNWATTAAGDRCKGISRLSVNKWDFF